MALQHFSNVRLNW